MTDRAIAVLTSADFERTKKFYRYFGFVAEAEDEQCLTIRHEGVELMFFPSSLDWTGPELKLVHRGCVIRVADVAAWHARMAGTRMGWKTLGSPSLLGITDAVWPTPAFLFSDRDGNLIWVVQE